MPAQYPRGNFPARCGQGGQRGWRPTFEPRGTGFRSAKFYGRFGISGVTRDSTGVALGSCEVRLFKADASEALVATTTSDGSGNYSFSLGINSGYYWIEAYKSGSPDVAGTSVRTLVAA